MSSSNPSKRNVYKLMMDEDGISIWMNDVPLHQLKYGAVIPYVLHSLCITYYILHTTFRHLDVGDQTEFTLSTFSGKKPGAWVTLVGVTTMQIWFKDRGHKKGDIGRFIKDNHSMGLKMTQSEGISHGVKGMIGQFIAPAAYEAIQSRSDDGPNFVVFQ